MNYFQLWESKTIASAVKQYFRDLNKPLMTHTLYNKFIEAVKLESEEIEENAIHGVTVRYVSSGIFSHLA